MFPQTFQTIIQTIDKALYSEFFMIPILGGIVLVFFFAFIVYSAVKTRIVFEFLGDFITSWNRGVLSEGKFRGSWKEIQKNMAMQDELSWHKALISADDILEEIIETMGYPGATMDERIQHIDPAHFPYINEAASAHKVRLYFEQNPDYRISREAAEKTLDIYKRIFEELGVV